MQSLTRAFALLELLAQAGAEVTLSSLAASSGLPVSTVYRFMNTLTAHGFARRTPERGYILGPRLIHLGDRAARSLATLAQPHLTALADTLGETANLALLDGDRAVYAAQAPSRHAMRMFTEVGWRVPLHCTGVGKTLLAQLDHGAARELLGRSGMPARTGRTVTDPETLMAQLPHIAARGYAVDDGELEVGVRCLAVPVPNSLPAAALSISAPQDRLPTQDIPRLTAVLQSTAAALGDALSVEAPSFSAAGRADPSSIHDDTSRALVSADGA